MIVRLRSAAAPVVGVIVGVLAAAAAVAHPGSSVHTAVFGGGGLLTVLGTVAGKLYHDRGVKMANLQAGATDLIHSLPTLRSDLASVKSFVEGEWPASKAVINDSVAKLVGVEEKVESLPGVADVRKLIDATLVEKAVAAAASAPPA